MEGSADFLDRLTAALAVRSQWLETALIPRLKDVLTAYDAQFEGVVGLIIRKGLLREDPYNYDQAFTDIVIPKDDMLPEFENSDELSFRLTAFRRQLKFAITEYPLDLSSLALARLKKLSALLFYVNWLDFGEGSKSPTTKAFARTFMKVRMGSDTMASQILKDSEMQIMKTLKEVRGILADLISYDREAWKCELRHSVLSGISFGEGARRDDVLKAIRRGFAQAMSAKPWYPALEEEVADEELSADGEARKQKILSGLALPEPARAESAPERNGREFLLDAIRIISRPHEEIATALAVLEENEKLLGAPRQSGGWLKRLFGGGGGPKEADRTYKVEYSEPGSPSVKVESIDFASFVAEAGKKASMLGSLASGGGSAFRKVESTGNGPLASFVDRQLTDVLLIHRRLGSLNTLFQARAAADKRNLRGIKVELLTIKNSLVKANQKRHEFKDEGAE
jgi:hypothetical protein